ncbi:FkbM family methyltransferase [Winogradskyella sp.]|uniref:FkbM family methyltransferase n=1 Tax=Winogradskyella sp. TaxID=1883156 RepID=UPI00351628F2
MKHYIKKAILIFNKNITAKISNKYKLNHKDKGVINFIDIGSVGGLPEPWQSNAFRVKYLLNFEPNETIKEGLNFMTYNTAIWRKEEERPFYIYKGLKGTGSSLLEQNYEYVQENFDSLKNKGPKRLAITWFERSKLVKTLNLKCKSLDAILNEKFPSKDFHFIKIDAQGAELNILKGAETALKKCVGLHLELFSIPLYKNMALLPEVEEYLSQHDFKLVKKFPPHGTFNSQNDCLFLKKKEDDTFAPLIRQVYNI